MKLEPPFLISESKLTRYLLVPLPTNDKSNYLRFAGYTVDNWQQLAHDLLTLGERNEATLERSSVYGISYSVTGQLTGPNGRVISVKTIWMRNGDEELTKFITLYPST